MWGTVENVAHITKRGGQLGMFGSIMAGMHAFIELESKYPGFSKMDDKARDALLAPHTDTTQSLGEWGPEEIADTFAGAFWISAGVTLAAFIVQSVAASRAQRT